MVSNNISSFTDVLSDDDDVIPDSQPISLSPANSLVNKNEYNKNNNVPKEIVNSVKHAGQRGQFRSIDEIGLKYRSVFTHNYFNIVQSNVIEDALYSDNSLVLCAPTGCGKTVVFEMAIVRLLMELEKQNCSDDFKIIYMAPVKALCTERLTEWYPKFTKLGLMCIEVTGDTDVEFGQLKPYRIIITTPEKWDMLTRRWRDHRNLVEVVKLFLIDEVHILNDESRGPVLEAVVSRMKTIESSAQAAYRIERLQREYNGGGLPATKQSAPKIRFVAVSATVSNPEDVASWLTSGDTPAVHHKFDSSCRPVALRTVVEGVPARATSGFKFDIALNYRLWPIIHKYYNGKPTLIFCNTRKSVTLTAETLCRELTVNFGVEQKQRLAALAANIKTKKLQTLVLNGVGCHHAGLLYEERLAIEQAFRNRDLPILITTTTLAMGVNLPAHLVIIKNTQQYVNGGYQEYSISTVLQMVGRAGRPQFDTDATAVIITRAQDKHRYETLVGGEEPLQSYLHKRLAENLNSEVALGTVNDVAQCVHWLNSTFLRVRAARDPRRYLGLPPGAPTSQITKKLEELCVKAMNGLASSGLISMDDASCIESTEAGRLMSVYYLDLETMKLIMKVKGTEGVPELLWAACAGHEPRATQLRADERRALNALNRSGAAGATIRYRVKGKITTRQLKLYCIIQAVLGCLPIPDPSLNQEAMKIMRIAERICKCLVAYITRPEIVSQQSQYFTAVLSSVILAKCVVAHLWEDSPYVSKQLRGIGPTFSSLLASAGKVNFMLLEESHPRDLERIMNKGPPAGNILRKQISLLPKYQITMTPVDEMSVNLQITLLNQAHLAENIDQLTAGENHKSYIIVGDSMNRLLLFTTFKDKDLISVYDGMISRDITRIDGDEHKVFAHVISSTYVGIDVHNEYLFKDIRQKISRNSTLNDTNVIPKPNVTKKQTYITDIFKERKRVNNSTDIADSKEKRKRENALIEKFQALKNSFSTTSKEIKRDLDKTADTSKLVLQNLEKNQIFSDKTVDQNKAYQKDCNTSIRDEDLDKTTIQTIEDISVGDCDGFIDDERIDNILNDIEKEIDNTDSNKKLTSTSKYDETSATNTNYRTKSMEPKKVQPRNRKSNYSYIDLLAKKIDLSGDENDDSTEGTGFIETVKDQIGKFFQEKRQNMFNTDDITINQTVNTVETTKLEKKQNSYEEITKTDKSELQENNKNTSCFIETNEFEGKQIETNNANYIKLIEIKEKENNKENNMDSTNDFKNVSIVDSPSTGIHRDLLPTNIPTNDDTKSRCMSSETETCYKNNALATSGTNSTQIDTDIRDNIVNFRSVNTNTIDAQVLNITNDYQPRIRSNFSQTSTKVCYKDNLCSQNSENIANFISNDSTFEITNENIGNKTKNPFVTQYSISKTKINVCTENGADHNIHIIRKTKVDMNITKIVSQHNSKYSKQINLDQNEEIIGSNKPDPLFAIDNICERLTHKKELKDMGVQLQEKTDVNDVINDNNHESYKSFKLNNENTNHETVNNILGKYGTILRKRDQESINKSTNLRHAISNENKPLNPKRPFKITDLSRVDTPLPDRFKIEANENITVIRPTTVGNNSMQDRKPELASTNEKQIVTFPNDELTNDQINDINTELLELQPSTIDFKVDQVMFNPKILLQTITDDTCMIIPPPPQFSDLSRSSTYSPVHNEFINLKKDITCVNNDNFNSQDLNNTLLYDNNFSLNSCDIDLTPSKEIETWNLEIDENQRTPRQNYGLDTLPFSVQYNKNKPIFSVSDNEPDKLQQYKFEQKSKLKLI